MKLNVGSFLTQRARLQPEQTALIVQNRCLSFQQLNERANRFANALRARDLKKGERVALLLPNSSEFLECFFGLAKLGAIAVTLNWRLAPPELEYICSDSGVRVLVYGEEFAQTVEVLGAKLALDEYICVGQSKSVKAADYEKLLSEQASAEPEPVGEGDDPLIIMYTSGTTGRPKGAVISHANLFWGSVNLIYTLDFRTNDRFLIVMPFFHIGGLIQAVIAVPAMLQALLRQPDIKQRDAGARAHDRSPAAIWY